MHVVSLNVGRIEEIPWQGQIVSTGFRKRPVGGRVRFRGTNLEGDEQADQIAHGGRRKAIYVYPSEHYRYWQAALRSPTLSWGTFGENLTTAGWPESEAHLGDVVRIGSAELEVTQPRGPCYKMNASFSRSDMIAAFLSAGRSGFYLGPISDGEMGAGDPIELLHRQPGSPSIAEVVRSAAGDEGAANPR